MIQLIPPQDENNTQKYPVIFTVDNGAVWLKRHGQPAKKVTAWVLAAIAAAFIVMFNPF
ncbi:TPA: hypothetical protein ACQQ5N_002716 [Pseudomonas aeruginosa]